MVVFTCQKCNSTLKKNAVEKHFSCRPFFLTCIDCLKDFRRNEYDAHTSCISEAEKYGGGKTVAKQQGVKQEKWAESAREILSEISRNPKYQKLCGVLKQASNIPRNRNKFHNFIRSAHPKIYNSEIANEIFDHLEKIKINNKNESSINRTQSNTCVENTPENNINEKNLQKEKKKNKKETTDVENSVNLDESVARNEDEISSNKRPLIETDFQSAEIKQNGDGAKKRKCEMKMNSTSNNHCLNNEVNNQNKENKDEANETDENKLNKLLNEEPSSEKVGEKTNVKLSRRARKKLKKQEKYMAEVAEIESVQPEEESVSLEQEDKVGKKKNEKQKAEKLKTETGPSTEHSPKRKHEKDDGVEDNAGKKIKLNETLKEEDIPIESGGKFKWGQIIKQVLENNPNKEMSLKKLRKKVMNEYKAQKFEDTPYEKLLGIFNKKVNSTEGIKVIKDRAILIVE